VTWQLADRPLRSILLTRLRYLGDVVMSTILLEALRAGDPHVRLGYLCEQGHGPVLVDHPCLDRLHLLGARRHGADVKARTTAPRRSPVAAHGTLGMIRELRGAGYDLAVDLFFNPRSAWLLRFSGIGARIGGTTSWRRHLYTDTVIAETIRRDWPQLADLAPGGLGDHLARLAPLTHVESGQDFLTWLGGHFSAGQLKPDLTAGNVSQAEPYVVLAPGATWETKEWPPARWRELLTRLAAGPGPRLRLLIPPGRENIWGEPGREFAAERFEVLPPLDLDAVKDLLGGASAVIAVDGGVMHMAVALGVPTVGLFGPTDPAIWFPYEKMGPYRVLATVPPCHPCDLHQCDRFICLPELAVDRVLTTLAELVPFAVGSADRRAP